MRFRVCWIFFPLSFFPSSMKSTLFLLALSQATIFFSESACKARLTFNHRGERMLLDKANSHHRCNGELSWGSFVRLMMSISENSF